MNPQLWWFVARATGLVAWATAVASLLVGLALASRALGARPKGPWLLSLHRWLGGLTLVWTGAHVGALVLDSYVEFDLADVMVPFAATWRPAATAAGVAAAWLLVAVEVTSLQMRRLPKRVWRAIHLSSYAMAVLATAHGFAAGSDTTDGWFAVATVLAVAAATFLLTYRAFAPAARAARARTDRPPVRVARSDAA